MKNLTIIIFLLSYSTLSFAYRPIDKVVTILNECRWNEKVTDIKTDCNDLFHHYLPSENKYTEPETVRLGSYNIFRLSEQQFKRLDITAEMMNQSWDIIALSEVQPNRSDDLQFNINALVALEQGKISKSTFSRVYAKPRYLMLLEELQKRDKSWGLVISPFSQGTDSELFGFFYRANNAQIIESDYCKFNYIDNPDYQNLNVHREYRVTRNASDGGVSAKGGSEKYTRPFVKPKTGALACTLALDGLGLKRFSKIPLTARFKSGKFDFSYITLHLRFRADDTELNKCKEKCKATAAEMLATLGLSDSQFKSLAGDSKGSKITNGDAREIARFFEAATTFNESVKIKKAESDKDVIVAGDYNLNYKTSGKWAPLWKALINIQENSEVLVKSKTSISNKEGLSNNYDHFVLTPVSGHTDECNIDSAKSVNFLTSDFILSSELDKYLDESNFDQIAQEYRDFLSSQEVIDSKGNLVSYEDLADSDDVPSEFIKKYKVCRIDNEHYDVGCSSPSGINGQVIRDQNDIKKLSYCDKNTWISASDYKSKFGKPIEKASLPKMAEVKFNPIDGAINNLFCQILYHNPDLLTETLETIHPRHKTRINYDGKPLASGKIPGAEVYKPYTTLMSDHVPISMSCSAQKGDN